MLHPCARSSNSSHFARLTTALPALALLCGIAACGDSGAEVDLTELEGIAAGVAAGDPAGVVVDVTGPDVITGATVSILDSAGTLTTLNTEEGARAVFPDVAAGSYDLEVRWHHELIQWRGLSGRLVNVPLADPVVTSTRELTVDVDAFAAAAPTPSGELHVRVSWPLPLTHVVEAPGENSIDCTPGEACVVTVELPDAGGLFVDVVDVAEDGSETLLAHGGDADLTVPDTIDPNALPLAGTLSSAPIALGTGIASVIGVPGLLFANDRVEIIPLSFTPPGEMVLPALDDALNHWFLVQQDLSEGVGLSLAIAADDGSMTLTPFVESADIARVDDTFVVDAPAGAFVEGVFFDDEGAELGRVLWLAGDTLADDLPESSDLLGASSVELRSYRAEGSAAAFTVGKTLLRFEARTSVTRALVTR